MPSTFVETQVTLNVIALVVLVLTLRQLMYSPGFPAVPRCGLMCVR
jgi:hypothetical protein